MGAILRLGLNELRLAWKDRTSAVWMVIMPIVFILFFGSVMGGGGGDPSDTTIRLTVVDQDVSWVSRSMPWPVSETVIKTWGPGLTAMC